MQARKLVRAGHDRGLKFRQTCPDNHSWYDSAQENTKSTGFDFSTSQAEAREYKKTIIPGRFVPVVQADDGKYYTRTIIELLDIPAPKKVHPKIKQLRKEEQDKRTLAERLNNKVIKRALALLGL